MDRVITVLDYEIRDSKYTEKGNGKCLYLQINLNEELRIVFTGSVNLMDMIKRVPDGGFPFKAKIVKDNPDSDKLALKKTIKKDAEVQALLAGDELYDNQLNKFIELVKGDRVNDQRGRKPSEESSKAKSIVTIYNKFTGGGEFTPEEKAMIKAIYQASIKKV